MAKNRREMRHLDDNILQEILSRLPAKSLARFTAACSIWKEIISDRYFKATHARRWAGEVVGIFSITANSLGGQLNYVAIDGSEAPDTAVVIGHPHPPSVEVESFQIKAACNGLILYKLHPNPTDRRLLLGNPTTGAHRRLPSPSSIWGVLFGLAFNPAASPASLRVVGLRRNNSNKYEFSILDASGAWRVSNESLPCKYGDGLFKSVASVYYGGALHWLGEGGVVAFNVEEEKADRIELPEGLRITRSFPGGNYLNVWFGVARDCVVLVRFEEEEGEMIVWALGGGGRWELKQKIRTVQWAAGYYVKKVPVLYDGKKFVLFTWSSPPGEFGVAVYRVEEGRWDKIRKFERWMDTHRHFFPHIIHRCLP